MCARAAASTAAGAVVAWAAGIGAREKVERLAATVGDDLDDVRICEFLGIANRPAERADVDRGIRQQRPDRGVDRFGFDERLVTLKVDDELAGQRRDDLGDAVGSGGMIASGHHRCAAERLDDVGDALIVGRDDDGMHRRGARGAAIDVFDHRTAGDVEQHLRREPTRVVSGRNDGEDRRFSQREWQPRD